MDQQQSLREHILYLLKGGGAHLDFESAITDLAVECRGQKPENLPHTVWELLEHMRICQWDILEYSRDPSHVSPEHPVGYWPDSSAPPSETAWEESLAGFRHDLQEMIALVSNPETDLLAPIPHGSNGHTILREALLIVDHNAYHLGQLVLVQKALGCWD